MRTRIIRLRVLMQMRIMFSISTARPTQEGMMASVKLTTMRRNSLRAKMLRHRFADDVSDLIGRRAAFAKLAYEEVYSAADRRKMEGLPKGWLPTSTGIKFQSSGSVSECLFSGRIVRGGAAGILKSPPDDIERLVPHRDCGYGGYNLRVVGVFDAGHPISEEWSKLGDDLNTLNKAIADTEAQIIAILASVSTTGRLREEWPEAAPFLIDLEGGPVKMPPALPINVLNSLLRLPVAA
jgi:hypothetical protein